MKNISSKYNFSLRPFFIGTHFFRRFCGFPIELFGHLGFRGKTNYADFRPNYKKTTFKKSSCRKQRIHVSGTFGWNQWLMSDSTGQLQSGNLSCWVRLSVLVFLVLRSGCTSNCIFEIHFVALDGFDLNTVHKLSSKEKNLV